MSTRYKKCAKERWIVQAHTLSTGQSWNWDAHPLAPESLIWLLHCVSHWYLSACVMLVDVKKSMERPFLLSDTKVVVVLYMILSTLRGYGKQWTMIRNRDFPGGAVVENPPANAGDTGSIPGPGRSHMLRATTTEACAPRARAPKQEKPPQWEACCIATKSSPRSPQLEEARTQQQRPNTAKNK